MIPPEVLLAVAAIALLSGTLIGMMGVGGVLLVPLLTGALGLPLVESIAAAACGFLASGVVAVAFHAREGRLRAGTSLLLWIAAGAGALAGAAALLRIPPSFVAGFIAFVAIVSGAASLSNRTRADDAPLKSGPVVALGTVTGVGSALSGTGGAVVLLPLLLLRGSTVRSAIAYAQSVQIPIALFATAFYIKAGVLNPALAGAAAIGLVPGTALGARIAARLPYDTLRRIVASILIAVGGWYGASLA
ncbi:MAG TPA: sulfite exporter TauE/SafE family protein [Burkholderiales bacterium]|nr:sulfite exporter TauE/SafE family protein [Burkholderiales bacterium]